MKRQKSFEQEEPSIYLVPTPIGNLQEMSERALEILKSVDVIACEDTRNTGKLLKHFDIKKPLLSHHEHNQDQSISKILDKIKEGQSVAIVSDAGYPLISDPGSYLVKQSIEQDIPVISISGPNAALDALVASGLETKHYLFYGFLDAKSKKRIQELEELASFPYTILFYEAPHRIEACLKVLLSVFGDRKIVLAREISKLHEEYLRGTISEILEVCSTLKGEMVLVVSGAKKEENQISIEDAAEFVHRYMEDGLSMKKAVQQTASDLNVSKNELYQYIVKNGKFM